jgi:hypothetical protein
MKISTVFDHEGHIIAAQETPQSAPAGTASIHLLAGPGEHLAEFDVPSHHSGKKFADFVHLLRVDVSGAKHRLIDR